MQPAFLGLPIFFGRRLTNARSCLFQNLNGDCEHMKVCRSAKTDKDFKASHNNVFKSYSVQESIIAIPILFQKIAYVCFEVMKWINAFLVSENTIMLILSFGFRWSFCMTKTPCITSWLFFLDCFTDG